MYLFGLSYKYCLIVASLGKATKTLGLKMKSSKSDMNAAIDNLNAAKELIKKFISESQFNKELYDLNELKGFVEKFSKDTGITKQEICTLSGVSSTTLTSALKNPEKASMTTITSIGSVVGYTVYFGRSNAKT